LDIATATNDNIEPAVAEHNGNETLRVEWIEAALFFVRSKVLSRDFGKVGLSVLQLYHGLAHNTVIHWSVIMVGLVFLVYD